MTRFSIALALTMAATVSTAGQYHITDLGTLGGSDSYAYGINNQGQVVGDAEDATGVEIAYIWQDGVMIDIDSWLSVPSNTSQAVEVNDNRVVVGSLSFFSDVGFAAADGTFLLIASGSDNHYARHQQRGPGLDTFRRGS